MINDYFNDRFCVCVEQASDPDDEIAIEAFCDADSAKHYATEFLIDCENNPDSDDPVISVYVVEMIAAGLEGDRVFEGRPRRPDPAQMAFAYAT